MYNNNNNNSGHYKSYHYSNSNNNNNSSRRNNDFSRSETFPQQHSNQHYQSSQYHQQRYHQSSQQRYHQQHSQQAQLNTNSKPTIEVLLEENEKELMQLKFKLMMVNTECEVIDFHLDSIRKEIRELEH